MCFVSSTSNVLQQTQILNTGTYLSDHNQSDFHSQGMVNCSRRYPVAGCLSSLPQASGWTRGKCTADERVELNITKGFGSYTIPQVTSILPTS